MENVIRVEDGKYVGGAAIPIKDFVEVVGDGVKTYNQLYAELYALLNLSKVSLDSYLISYGYDNTYQYRYPLSVLSPTQLEFNYNGNSVSGSSFQGIKMNSSAATCSLSVGTLTTTGYTVTEYGNNVYPSGLKIRLIY